MKPSVQLNVGSANEPAVLGNALVTFLEQFVDLFAAHFHIGNIGNPTPLDPASIATANVLKAANLTSRLVLSDYINLSKLPV